jgi:hypothetical protein
VHLLLGLSITHPNQVWMVYITYLRMPSGFMYLGEVSAELCKTHTCRNFTEGVIVRGNALARTITLKTAEDMID